MITDVYMKNYKQIINLSFYFRNNWGKGRVKTTSVYHATSPTPNPFSTSLVHQLITNRFHSHHHNSPTVNARRAALHPTLSYPFANHATIIALLYGYLFFVTTRPQTSAHSLTSRNLHWSNHPLNQCYMPNLYHVIWQLHLFSLIVYLRLWLIPCHGITVLF